MQLHERYDSQKCQLPPCEIIVGTPPPLSLLKGRGRTFQKLEGQNFLLERGNKPVKMGVDVEMGGRGVATFLLLYSLV